MSSPITRRGLLGMGAGSLAASALAIPGSSLTKSLAKKPKNIIFCVSDGMAASVPTMVDHLSQLRDGKPSYWHWLMNQDFVVNGLQDTRSLNSLVTDSSAASSAWGSGRHIWNGMVNMFPDGTSLRTLASILKDAKMHVGLVTTATITHATPAGFAVNCENRDLEAVIAEKYLESGIEVLMGGGDKFFSASKRKDGKDLYKAFQDKGYSMIRDRDQCVAAKGEKLLGVFSNGHVPYSVDRNNSLELQKSCPTLAQMAKTAIATLDAKPGGFLLQVEGARVDHGGHANDLAAMIYDQIAFEEAVKTAIEFALQDGETLVVVTADHATGGVALNGSGDEYIDSTAGLKSVLGMTASYDVLFAELGDKPTASDVRDIVAHRLGIKLTTDEAEAAAAPKSPFSLSEFKTARNATLAMILGNHTKVGFTSNNHTNDHVIVTAMGPMSHAFAGLRQNTSYFDTFLAARDLKVVNPTMTFEDAARHYEKMKSKVDKELYAAACSDDEIDHGAPDWRTW